MSNFTDCLGLLVPRASTALARIISTWYDVEDAAEHYIVLIWVKTDLEIAA